MLPLLTNLLGDPPDAGVVEQQRLDDRLQKVYGVVVAADVRDLVRQDHLQLRNR